MEVCAKLWMGYRFSEIESVKMTQILQELVKDEFWLTLKGNYRTRWRYAFPWSSGICYKRVDASLKACHSQLLVTFIALNNWSVFSVLIQKFYIIAAISLFLYF